MDRFHNVQVFVIGADSAYAAKIAEVFGSVTSAAPPSSPPPPPPPPPSRKVPPPLSRMEDRMAWVFDNFPKEEGYTAKDMLSALLEFFPSYKHSMNSVRNILHRYSKESPMWDNIGRGRYKGRK